MVIQLEKDGKTKMLNWESRRKWRNRFKYLVWMWWLIGVCHWKAKSVATNDEYLYHAWRRDPSFRKEKCRLKLLKNRR